MGYENMRRRLALRIIKNRDSRDPVANITVGSGRLEMVEYDKKRVGQPRNAWWHFAVRELWKWIGTNVREDIRYETLDMEKEQHRNILIEVGEEAQIEPKRKA